MASCSLQLQCRQRASCSLRLRRRPTASHSVRLHRRDAACRSVRLPRRQRTSRSVRLRRRPTVSRSLQLRRRDAACRSVRLPRRHLPGQDQDRHYNRLRQQHNADTPLPRPRDSFALYCIFARMRTHCYRSRSRRQKPPLSVHTRPPTRTANVSPPWVGFALATAIGFCGPITFRTAQSPPYHGWLTPAAPGCTRACFCRTAIAVNESLPVPRLAHASRSWGSDRPGD
jgi:hypothetical protein